MECIKRIEKDGYAFELVLRSRTIKAHALMTDMKETLKNGVMGESYKMIKDEIDILVPQHKENNP